MSGAEGRWTEVRAMRAEVPEHVVFRDMAQQTVLLNVDTGTYHSIDEVGRRFFEEIRAADRLENAAPPLAREFDQPVSVIQTDLAAFCAQLVKEGLIRLTPPA